MKMFILCAVSCGLVLTVPRAAAQTKVTDFLIDTSKSYVYLKFDHLGGRKRLGGDEVDQGLWIRFVNNCRIPVILGTFSPGTGDPGIGVYDEIVAVAAKGPVVHLEKSRNGRLRSFTQPAETMPEGYSPPDVFSTSRVLPGESLLFSVPANHVGPSWSLQVRFYFDVPGAVFGSGPYSLVSFDWVDIPEQLRGRTAGAQR